jgi:hypothetical protein
LAIFVVGQRDNTGSVIGGQMIDFHLFMNAMKREVPARFPARRMKKTNRRIKTIHLIRPTHLL